MLFYFLASITDDSYIFIFVEKYSSDKGVILIFNLFVFGPLSMIALLKVRKNKFIYFSLKLFFLALVSYSFALVAHSFFSNLRIELLAGIMMTFSYTLFCTFYAAWV